MPGDETPSVPATRASLQRLLAQMRERGWGEPGEVAALLERVHAARTTSDLLAVAQHLAPFVAARPGRAQGHERREAPRKPCSLLLRVLEDGSHGIHFIRDIGMGGLSLNIQAPLPLFPVLHCQLPLYHLGRVYEFTARVVWCRPDPPGVIGLQFVEVGDDLKEWLTEFLDVERIPPPA